MAIPLASRTRTDTVVLAPGGYVSHTSPSPPYLRRRYLTRLEHEALGKGSVSWDVAVRPVHNDGAPTLKR